MSEVKFLMIKKGVAATGECFSLSALEFVISAAIVSPDQIANIMAFSKLVFIGQVSVCLLLVGKTNVLVLFYCKVSDTRTLEPCAWKV